MMKFDEIKVSSFLEAAPDALITVSAEGKIVHFNKQAEALFDFSRAEVIGQKIEVLIPERYHANHLHHREHYFQHPRIRPMGMGLELYGARKGGMEFPIEISLSPLTTDTETMALAAVRDISERKKAEAKFKGILEATPDALVIINKSGQIILVNNQAEKLFNYPRQELLGMLIEILIPKRYQGTHESRRNDYFKNPRVRPMGKGHQLFGLRSDGSEFPVEISLSPLESEEGPLALAAVRDITERRQLEQTLAEKNLTLIKQVELHNQQQAKFIAHLCHELRNPVNGSKGSIAIIQEYLEELQKLLDQQQDSLATYFVDSLTLKLSKTRESLNDISTCIEHEESILNANLDIAKITEEKLQLIDKPFSLHKIMNDVYSMFKAKAHKKNLEYTMALPTEDLILQGDPVRITQIISNLTSNALKFTDYGKVNIALTIKDQTVFDIKFEIGVSDTGIGFAEEEIGRLFERFSQVSPQHQYTGSGLGLVISKKLANLMGGDIEVVKSEQGKGSTFSCVLRCKKSLELEPERPKIMPIISIRGLTVLVVDDNEINRKILAKPLEKAGCKCIFATNGKEAVNEYVTHSIKKSKQPPIDVILMDVVMPEVDGLEATRRIRRIEAEEKQSKPVPIIGLSGNALVEQQIEAKNAGMNEYLIKPYNAQQIIQTIAILTPPKQEAQPSSNPVEKTKVTPIQQSHFHHHEQINAAPIKRVWMAEPLRKELFSVFDALASEFSLLGTQSVKPALKFFNKISPVGWQFYSLPERKEHWAAINIDREDCIDKLVQAINESGAKIRANKMKSGTAHVLVIKFSQLTSLGSELDKAKLYIQEIFGFPTSSRVQYSAQ